MKIYAQAITIEQGSIELSKPAFYVWIRLISMSRQKLLTGKLSLSKIFGYGYSRFCEILKELYNKDYIAYKKPKNRGNPIGILIKQTALISGANSFVILKASKKKSNNMEMLDIKGKNMKTNTDNVEHGKKQENDKKDTTKNNNNSPKTTMSKNEQMALREKLIALGRKKALFIDEPNEKLYKCEETEIDQTICDDVKPPFPPLNPPYPQNNKTNSYVTSSNTTRYARNITRMKPTVSHNTRMHEEDENINKSKLATRMVQKREADKQKQKEERARKLKKIKNSTGKINKNKFSALDGKKISISFDPNSKIRVNIIQTLEFKKNDPARKKLMKKIKTEVSRIYHSYLAMLWKARGHEGPAPFNPENAKKYAAKIGVNCLYNGITPRQLIEYWDEHIGNFADKSLKYPPMHFLASTMASEQVAAALLKVTSGNTKRWKNGDFKQQKQSDNRHPFANTNALHPDLRTGLIRAGFNEARVCDDRYLMTVQLTAKSIAEGKKLFVGGKLKEMVMWAAKNLFKKQDNNHEDS